jgi:hypothetical protein
VRLTARFDDTASDRPTKSMMSACETITWIAFRRTVRLEELVTLYKVTPFRWFSHPAVTVLEALEARAGLSGDGPFCAIRKANDPPGRDTFPSRHTIFTREGPAALRWIRAQHRRDTGKLLSYADLTQLLREDIAFDELLSAQIDEGKAELKDRAAGKKLVAYGIPTWPDGSRAADEPVSLPATLFMDPAMTLTERDTLHADSTKPMKDWGNQKVPRFKNIQFRTEQVLELWPPQPAASGQHSEPSPTPEPSGPGRIDTLPVSAHEAIRRQQASSYTLDDTSTRAAASPPDQRAVRSTEPSDRPQSASDAGLVDQKVPFTAELLRAEYRAQVARWEATGGRFKPPSREADRKWADRWFHDTPRSALRKARKELAPESWRKSGKRAGADWPE